MSGVARWHLWWMARRATGSHAVFVLICAAFAVFLWVLGTDVRFERLMGRVGRAEGATFLSLLPWVGAMAAWSSNGEFVASQPIGRRMPALPGLPVAPWQRRALDALVIGVSLALVVAAICPWVAAWVAAEEPQVGPLGIGRLALVIGAGAWMGPAVTAREDRRVFVVLIGAVSMALVGARVVGLSLSSTITVLSLAAWGLVALAERSRSVPWPGPRWGTGPVRLRRNVAAANPRARGVQVLLQGLHPEANRVPLLLLFGIYGVWCVAVLGPSSDEPDRHLSWVLTAPLAWSAPFLIMFGRSLGLTHHWEPSWQYLPFPDGALRALHAADAVVRTALVLLVLAAGWAWALAAGVPDDGLSWARREMVSLVAFSATMVAARLLPDGSVPGKGGFEQVGPWLVWSLLLQWPSAAGWILPSLGVLILLGAWSLRPRAVPRRAATPLALVT